MELTDSEIILRPFKLENAEEHLVGDDEENIKWLSGGVSTIETVRNWILKNQRSWENNGPIFNFAIFNAKTKKLVGMVEGNSDPKTIKGLHQGEVNISYNVYPFARGQGYAAKAVNLLTGFLKQKGFQKALIRVNQCNKNSLGVPVQCGFIRIGLRKTKTGEKMIHFVKQLQ
jgi:RimJ/RimL family protein N-acetyltransferase